VVGLAKRRKIRPAPVDLRPADGAARALDDLKAGRVLGRIVLNFESVAA
jgi:D-arabinose 1-dehydrogenase-like Zn-dependent alcohol dehydrogenase